MKSLREKAVMAVLLFLLLYGLVAALWLMNLDRKMGWCPKTWGDAMRSYEKACRTYADECRLISRKKELNEAYESEKAAMPMFAADKATDTTWQRRIDALAETNHISIAQSTPGKEIMAGEVLELPIEVRNWEGALESLVKFLHALENAPDGMYDIRAINIRPSNKKGYLKGSMTVTCAYMREK